MSKSKNYTITSLSSSLNQISKRVFTAASNTRIRGGYAPYTLVKSKKGDVEGKEEFPKFPFGRFGPVNAGVTAATNLIHWWKLTDDPAEGEAVDYGTSGSAATNLAVVDASTATGPTELGSPTVFSFDGVNDIVKTEIIDSLGTKNSIANLYESNYYTISWWVKDNGAAPWPQDLFWSAVGGVAGGSYCMAGGGQAFANNYGTNDCFIFNNSGEGCIGMYVDAAYQTGWHHYAVTVDLREVTGDNCFAYSYKNGAQSYDAYWVRNGYPHGSKYRTGGINYWFTIGGMILSSSVTATRFAPCDVCDFRMYDRLLTPTEIANIAAGDWT